ncbi:hypothetical protein BVRB_037040, partial [Beta vulgaris subsp. vulgaris]
MTSCTILLKDAKVIVIEQLYSSNVAAGYDSLKRWLDEFIQYVYNVIIR